MGRPRFDPRQQQRGFQIRVNHRIRVPEVRVIGADGDMLGVLATHEAMRIAQAAGLDLVEVNPKADPPVCKILDFGKYKYEEKKKTAEAKRKQTVVEIKEIKLRPKTDDHDVAFKTKAARRFLEAGHKVKVTVRFRGREITHPEKAQEQLQLVIAATEDLANIESRAMMEARTMTVLIAPKPQIMQKVAQAKIAAEKARQLAEKEGRPMPSEASLPSMSDLGDDDDDDDDDDEDDEDEDDDVEAPAADASAPAAAKSAPAAAKSAPAAAKSAPAVAKGAASEKKSEGGAVEATSGTK
jgi:translation initiation factor IF-3